MGLYKNKFTMKTTSRIKNTKFALAVLAVGGLTCPSYSQWTAGTGNPADIYWNTISNSVAVGVTQPLNKLHVWDDNIVGTNGLNAGYFQYDTPQSGTSVTYCGVYSKCTDTGANPTNTNVGVQGDGTGGTATNAGSWGVGVKGKALGGGSNFGGIFEGTGSGDLASGMNVGVFALTGAGGSTNAAIMADDGGVSTTKAGLFLGDVHIQQRGATSNGSARLFLNNTTGSNWSLNSTGSGGTSKNFILTDETAVGDRIFVSGNTSNS
jgi:hypothetical protein